MAEEAKEYSLVDAEGYVTSLTSSVNLKCLTCPTCLETRELSLETTLVKVKQPIQMATLTMETSLKV